jgi:hypothetical protein
MKKNGDQAAPDDVLDFRIRFHRAENPMLFRAISGFAAAPGVRTRNLFVRQLMEMGLMVMEERMRRQDGLSTRVSGGLVDEVAGAVTAMNRTAAAIESAPHALRSTPITATESSVTPEQTSASLSPTRVDPAPAPSSAEPAASQVPAPVARSERSAPASGERPAATSVRDDDRPPPRVPGFAGRRMLAGESYE